MPYQYQPLDLPAIFAAAQQAKLSEQNLRLGRLKEADFARQLTLANSLPEVRQGAIQGSMDPTQNSDLARLFSMAPDEYLALRAQQERYQPKPEDQAAITQRALRTAELQRAIASAPPDQQGPMLEAAKNLTDQGLVNRFEVPGAMTSPAQTANIAAQGATAERVLAKPEKPATTGDLTEFTATTGMKPGDLGFGPAFDKWWTAREKLKHAPQQMTVSLGSAAPSKQELTNEAKTLQIGMRSLGDIEAMKVAAGAKPNTPLKEVDFSKMVGFGPQFKGWALDKLDQLLPALGTSLPSEQQQNLESLATFRSNLDYFNAKQFHDLIGSAQTAQEIARLANAVASADMGSTKFKSAITAFERGVKRMNSYAQTVLSKGIPLGTPQFGQALDQLYFSGASTGGGSEAGGVSGRVTGPVNDPRVQQTFEALMGAIGEGQ